MAEGERVLEVGPGEGALTKVLLARGAVVIAVEKDHRLISFLQEIFAREMQRNILMLYEGDALEFDVKNIQEKKYKVVGNIPYYITGALLKKFLSADTTSRHACFFGAKRSRRAHRAQ